MRIQVGGLSEGLHEYRFRVEPSDLGLGEPFGGEVQITATLERVGMQYHLRAALSTLGTFVCDRCVTTFEREVRPSYQMYYVADEAEIQRYDPAEVQVLTPGFPVIDLAEDVRQVLQLAIPLKLLCREDCAGLCPRCAINLNEATCSCSEDRTDPRWEQLRRLTKN
jgi:uncharacterized protein